MQPKSEINRSKPPKAAAQQDRFKYLMEHADSEWQLKINNLEDKIENI